jgi:hypothetical protein
MQAVMNITFLPVSYYVTDLGYWEHWTMSHSAYADRAPLFLEGKY